MRFSLTSLIRLVGMLALASTAMAVGLSRLTPRPGIVRTPCPAGQFGVTGFLLCAGEQPSRWLDTSQGRLDELPMPRGVTLDYASRSPWSDNRGGYQVVGRYTPTASNTAVDGRCGLARISYPDGEILDRVNLNVIPLGPACWLEGTSARVIFGAGDGRLYRVAFERAIPGPVEPIPELIRWNDTPPSGETVFLSDPCSASDPRFGQILVVGLRSVEEREGVRRFGRSELWWLRLDEAGRSIVDSGLLVAPGPDSDVGELRSPSLSRTPGGDWILAYLQKSRTRAWELRMARLVVEDRHPRMTEPSGALLARDAGPASLGFSADGKRIWYIDAAERGASIRSVAVEAERGDAPEPD